MKLYFLLLIFFIDFSMAQSSLELGRYGFVSPVDYYDVHVYYNVEDPSNFASATALHKALATNFPSMPIYPMVNKPIGPHPLPMFETHLMNPTQFGQVLSWLCVHRGEHSILVHPNTGNTKADGLLDHSEHTIWLGQPLPLRLDIFKTTH